MSVQTHLNWQMFIFKSPLVCDWIFCTAQGAYNLNVDINKVFQLECMDRAPSKSKVKFGRVFRTIRGHTMVIRAIGVGSGTKAPKPLSIYTILNLTFKYMYTGFDRSDYFGGKYRIYHVAIFHLRVSGVLRIKVNFVKSINYFLLLVNQYIPPNLKVANKSGNVNTFTPRKWIFISISKVANIYNFTNKNCDFWLRCLE